MSEHACVVYETSSIKLNIKKMRKVQLSHDL